MEFTIKAGSPEKLQHNCVVVGAYAGARLSPAAQILDQASGGLITSALQSGDLDEKAGACLMLRTLPGVASSRVLLVSLGKAETLNDKAYRDAVSAAARQLAGVAAPEVLFCLAEAELPKRDLAWKLAEATTLLQDSTFRSAWLKSKREESPKGARQVSFLVPDASDATLQAALTRGQALAEGLALTKTLGNLPGNICTPAYLADSAKQLGKEYKGKIKVEILDQAEIEELGMGGLLAVAQGSMQEPRFIVLQYKGGKGKTAPVVLVGKGITFDTGGISL
ncbi:MAG: leucyl aminopeptidase, partial [Rhodocyclales bacterium]|nr:leucyl aminopeptidase [Rhodocyclales bacterium]